MDKRVDYSVRTYLKWSTFKLSLVRIDYILLFVCYIKHKSTFFVKLCNTARAPAECRNEFVKFRNDNYW